MSDLAALLARPGLPPGERVLIAAKVAVATNDWDRLDACIRAAQSHRVPRSHLEEVLLQAVLFYGFPRVVSAFETLRSGWPAAAPTGGALPVAEQAAAGEELFRSIYGDHADAVLTMLRSFHAEFCDFVLTAAYGRVLTRPGLPPRLRELLAVGALAALDQTPQLVAHGRGALTFGADEVELRETLTTAGADPATIEATLARILRER